MKKARPPSARDHVNSLLADLRSYDPDVSSVDIIKRAADMIERITEAPSIDDGQRVYRAMRNHTHLADIALLAYILERAVA